MPKFGEIPALAAVIAATRIAEIASSASRNISVGAAPRFIAFIASTNSFVATATK